MTLGAEFTLWALFIAAAVLIAQLFGPLLMSVPA
jgi:hypothetical protein